MAYILLGLLVFTSAVALDYASARYYHSLSMKLRHPAARWSVCMAALGTIGAASAYEISLWYLIPEFAGLYLGTLLAIPNE